MINYFIAVFGAGIALFGNVIGKNAVAGVIISAFLFLISVLFCSVDLRNRFDVKHSRCVITQIEHDYRMDRLKRSNADYVYGVFSNEDNTFRYYGFEHRREECNAEYRKLRKLYKKIKLFKKLKINKNKIESLQNEFKNKVDDYLKSDRTISAKEFISSMGNSSILSLSKSIKYMYYLCMGASVGGFIWSCFEAGIPNAIINLFK